MKKRLICIFTIIGLLMTGCSAKQVESQPEDLLAEVKERGVLKIGTEGTYAPYSYHNEKGELTGFDVEIGQAIAKQLGLKVEFVESNWDSCIAGLDAKRYDIVMNQVGITKERLAKYDFSTPYTIAKVVLLVSSENDTITSFEEMQGKTSAQSMTSNFTKLAEGYGAKIVSTDGLFSKAVELVTTGRADATINDELTYLDYIKKQPNAKVKVVAEQEEVSENAIMIRKGNDSFREEVNRALSELQENGTLAEISNRYFGKDITK